MTRYQYFQQHAAARDGLLATDAIMRRVAADFAAGRISSVAAVNAMRAADASEPEIREILARNLGSHSED